MKNIFKLILMLICMPLSYSIEILFNLIINLNSKYKKLIMISLLMLFSLSAVSAISITSNVAYYNFDNNLDDVTGNGYNLTNVGATLNSSGKINQAYDYDGTDYMTHTGAPPLTGDFAMGAWIYLFEEADANTKTVIESRDAGLNYNYNFNIQATTDLPTFSYYDGGFQNCVGTTDLVANTWYYIGATFNNTNNSASIYVNGVEDKTCTGLVGTPTTAGTQNLFIGADRGSGSFFQGVIDEVTIFDRGLDLQDFEELYNLDVGCQYDYTACAAASPTITSNLSTYYNSLTINVSLTTISNTDMNYTFNGGSETFICASCNVTSVLLAGVEGVNNVTWISNNGVGDETNNSESAIIDTIVPTITNSIPSGIFSYQFLDTFFSCSDTNLLSCNISIAGLNKAQNLNFTLPYNGNLSYNITAIDLAGNTLIESGVLLVNPYQYFRFIDDLGANVTNYTFAGVNFTDLATIPIYDIGLGNQSLAFEKDGFVTSYFPVTFNTTSAFNVTYNVSVSRIIITVYNQITKAILTNETLNLDLIGPTTLYTNSTTGTFNLSSYLLGGSYQVFITSTNYLSVQDDFIFNGTGVHLINLYMLPNNSTQVGYVNIITYKEDNTFYPEIPVYALEWDSTTNTFIQTYEIFSNTNGLATIPIILGDRIYKFCAEYPSGTTCFPTSILGITISPAQNGETFPILPDRNFPKVPLDLSALQITINNLTLTNYSDSFYSYYVNYDWDNTLGLTSTVCTRIEKDFNFSTSIISDTCSSSSQGNYINTFLLNNSFSYIFSIYTVEGTGEDEKFRQYIEGTETFFSFLERFGVKVILQILLVVVMIGIIPFIKNPFLIVADIILGFGISWKYLIPQDLSITSVGVIIIMGGITLWAMSKK